MVKNEKPYIEYDGIKYQCYKAGYTNPVQHKWALVIDGVESRICSGGKLKFFDMVLTITFTSRSSATSATNCFNNTSGRETFIEAWQI